MLCSISARKQIGGGRTTPLIGGVIVTEWVDLKALTLLQKNAHEIRRRRRRSRRLCSDPNVNVKVNVIHTHFFTDQVLISLMD